MYEVSNDFDWTKLKWSKDDTVIDTKKTAESTYWILRIEKDFKSFPTSIDQKTFYKGETMQWMYCHANGAGRYACSLSYFLKFFFASHVLFGK